MRFYYLGKEVGQLGEDSILRKDMKSKHILKKLNAIGLDAKMYDSLPEDTEIRIRMDGEHVYIINKKNADTVSANYGFGRQYFISLEQFTKL